MNSHPYISSHETMSQLMNHPLQMEGPRNSGTVDVHLTKRPGASEFEYRYLFLDIPGHQRIYLENNDAKTASGAKKYKFLGVNWS